MQLEAFARRDDSALPEPWRLALGYAESMTPTGGHVGDASFVELTRHWTPAQIVEITAVIALFNYFNRFADALAIPVTR